MTLRVGSLDRLRHQATSALISCLAQRGGRPPPLVRTELEYDPVYDRQRFYFRFDDATSCGFEVRARDLFVDFADWPDVKQWFERDYYRIYEDRLMHLQLEPLRQRIDEAIRSGVSHEHVIEAQRVYDDFAVHLRRHHAASFFSTPSSHRSWVRELYEAAPVGTGPDGTINELREGIDRQTREAIIGTHQWPDPGALTIEAVRAAAAQLMGQRHPREPPYFIVPEGLVADFDMRPGAITWIGVDVGSSEAQARGEQLLLSWLTPKQRSDYEKKRGFGVTGSNGGRYWIRQGRQMNIDELGPHGGRVAGWCFLPQGGLVAADCMLAQKIALETDEAAARRVANRF
jgi:hypothetical protein